MLPHDIWAQLRLAPCTHTQAEDEGGHTHSLDSPCVSFCACQHLGMPALPAHPATTHAFCHLLLLPSLPHSYPIPSTHYYHYLITHASPFCHTLPSTLPSSYPPHTHTPISSTLRGCLPPADCQYRHTAYSTRATAVQHYNASLPADTLPDAFAASLCARRHALARTSSSGGRNSSVGR